MLSKEGADFTKVLKRYDIDMQVTLTPEEMAECRRARIQSRTETARQFDNFYKSLDAFRKNPENKQ